MFVFLPTQVVPELIGQVQQIVAAQRDAVQKKIVTLGGVLRADASALLRGADRGTQLYDTSDLAGHFFVFSSVQKFSFEKQAVGLWSGAVVDAGSCQARLIFWQTFSLKQKGDDSSLPAWTRYEDEWKKDLLLPSSVSLKNPGVLFSEEQSEKKINLKSSVLALMFTQKLARLGFPVLHNEHKSACLRAPHFVVGSAPPTAVAEITSQSKVSPPSLPSAPLPRYLVHQKAGVFTFQLASLHHLPEPLNGVSFDADVALAANTLADMVTKKIKAIGTPAPPQNQSFQVLQRQGRWIYLRGGAAQGLVIGDRLLGPRPGITLHVIHYHPGALNGEPDVTVALIRDEKNPEPLRVGDVVRRDL